MADPVVGLPIWIWITAIVTATYTIFVVWLIMWFVWPAKSSFAKYIIKAKREGKPVVILDAGKKWKVIIGDTKVGKEKHEIIRSGDDIVKMSSLGMKYAEGGVLLGVGEDFRSLVANVCILDLMEMVDKKGWNEEEIKKRLDDISEGLKKDLGYVDELQLLREKHAKDSKTVNEEFDKLRMEILKGYPSGDPQGQGKADNPKENQEAEQ